MLRLWMLEIAMKLILKLIIFSLPFHICVNIWFDYLIVAGLKKNVDIDCFDTSICDRKRFGDVSFVNVRHASQSFFLQGWTE